MDRAEQLTRARTMKTPDYDIDSREALAHRLSNSHCKRTVK